MPKTVAKVPDTLNRSKTPTYAERSRKPLLYDVQRIRACSGHAANQPNTSRCTTSLYFRSTLRLVVSLTSRIIFLFDASPCGSTNCLHAIRLQRQSRRTTRIGRVRAAVPARPAHHTCSISL